MYHHVLHLDVERFNGMVDLTIDHPQIGSLVQF